MEKEPALLGDLEFSSMYFSEIANNLGLISSQSANLYNKTLRECCFTTSDVTNLTTTASWSHKPGTE